MGDGWEQIRQWQNLCPRAAIMEIDPLEQHKQATENNHGPGKYGASSNLNIAWEEVNYW
jgi:hypothetical protein